MLSSKSEETTLKSITNLSNINKAQSRTYSESRSHASYNLILFRKHPRFSVENGQTAVSVIYRENIIYVDRAIHVESTMHVERAKHVESIIHV